MPWFLGAVALVLAAAGATGQTPALFQIDGRSPTRVVVTRPDVSLDAPVPRDQMRRELSGVLADLDRPPQVRSVLRTLGTRRAEPTGAESPFVSLHLLRGKAAARLDVVRDADGRFFARRADGERIVPLNAKRFGTLASGWSSFRGSFEDPAPVTPGTVVEMPRPYQTGLWVLDAETMSERFLGGRRTRVPAVDRMLDEETLFVRLPTDYTAQDPPGLLVWVDPSDGGRPPWHLHAALDELSLVCVGAANAGNTREVADRYQLVFDAIETASRAVHIRRDRIYITGLSGGGRVSSILVGCFPEVFHGAVPIVGLSCYRNVPMGNGKHIPAAFRKPDTSRFTLLRERRIAPMTGPLDFNYNEMTRAVRILERDRLSVRMFEYEDMAHTMPTSERLADAMRWVDEPWRDDHTQDVANAEVALERLVGVDGAIDDAALREALSVPWSRPAWEAFRLLQKDQP